MNALSERKPPWIPHLMLLFDTDSLIRMFELKNENRRTSLDLDLEFAFSSEEIEGPLRLNMRVYTEMKRTPANPLSSSVLRPRALSRNCSTLSYFRDCERRVESRGLRSSGLSQVRALECLADISASQTKFVFSLSRSSSG
jgi:hypothetical protein